MTTAQFIVSYTASCEQRIREIAAMDAKTLKRKAPRIKGGRKARIAYLQDSVRDECKNQIAKAKAMDLRLLTAPENWASYLINGDASGLDSNEVALADKWLKRNNVTAVFDTVGEHYFTWWNMDLYVPDGNNAGGVVHDYRCAIRK